VDALFQDLVVTVVLEEQVVLTEAEQVVGQEDIRERVEQVRLTALV
jgi:hypothetical protein